MSVNLCDIQTGDIIDIVPDRRKRYWKVLLKNDFNLNGVKFCKYVHYKKWTNTKEILIDLLSLSDRLSDGHSLYQEFLYTIHNRDIDCFEVFLDRYLNQDSIPPGRIHHRVVADSTLICKGHKMPVSFQSLFRTRPLLAKASSRTASSLCVSFAIIFPLVFFYKL